MNWYHVPENRATMTREQWHYRREGHGTIASLYMDDRSAFLLGPPTQRPAHRRHAHVLFGACTELSDRKAEVEDTLRDMGWLLATS